MRTQRSKVVGAAVFKKKTPFAEWLDSQPRKDLTYDKDLPDRDGVGWGAEDFCMEALKRGLRGVRVQTVFKRRAQGNVPNSESLHALRKAFPTIRFER